MQLSISSRQEKTRVESCEEVANRVNKRKVEESTDYSFCTFHVLHRRDIVFHFIILPHIIS
jgi:hypothetical protein